MGRRGPKKQSVKREPNGKISRRVQEVAKRFYDNLEREEVQTLSVAIEARERLHSLDKSSSRDQKAGSFIGRLCLNGVVSNDQYEAAMTWLEERAAYLVAVAAPREHPGAVDLNRVQGRPVGAAHVTRDLSAVERYEASKKVIQDQQNELRGLGHLFGALQYVVEQDLPLHHLVGDCRTALNALSRHYKRVASRRAA